MAIDPSALYTGQVDTSDPTGYPHGKAQNSVALGDGAGFPLEKAWVNDLLGFEQALLAAVSATPTGTPDKAGASQYLNAINALISSAVTASGNAVLSALKLAGERAQAQNWPERASVTGSGLAANSDVPICWDNSGATGVFLGNRFCAVGNDQKSYTSEDGLLWTQRGLTGGVQIRDVIPGIVSGSPSFLAIDGGVNGTYHSTDGVSWSSGGAVGGPFGAAAYSPSLGIWVIAGSGTVSTSTDGITWTARVVPAGWAGKFPRRAAWAHSLFVIASATSYNKVLTSPDGTTWTERTIGTASAASWTGLAWGGIDGIWMITDGSQVFKSPDAITWTNCAPTGVSGLQDLAVNQSLWVGPTASGGEGGMNYSTDQGATWLTISVGSHIGSATGYARIIAADNRFVAARSSSAALEFALSLRSP